MREEKKCNGQRLNLEIIPAVLVKTREEFLEQINKVKDHVKEIHVDVMDSKFVPNYTVKPEEVEELPKGIQYEFHWMVEEPEKWIKKIKGNHLHQIHFETIKENWEEIKNAVKESGGRLCIALNPGTPVKKVEPYIKEIQRILIMSVVPGYSNQKYINAMEEKIVELREKHPLLEIEIDGGINHETIKSASTSGADKFVSCSAIFSSENIESSIKELHNNAQESSWLSMDKVKKIKELKLIANKVRQDVVKMLYEAKSGHSAGSIGLADIFTVLYFNAMNHDPKNAEWKKRDRLVLSNGHVCPVLYATMAEAGYFPIEELLTLRKLGSKLQGHPHKGTLPGIENSSGPLGQGLSQAVGMAIVGKTEHQNWRVFCVVSDGEQNEGQIWEAALLASKYKLGNLTAIMDKNNIQIDGTTEEVLPLEPLADKYKAFGWNVIEVDGHYIPGLIKAIEESKKVPHKPTMILAKTVPGKGIPFMEYLVEWHGKPPGKEQMEEALKVLEHKRKLIEAEPNGE